MANEKSFIPGLKLNKVVNIIKNVVTFELRDYTQEGIFTVIDTFGVEPIQDLNAKAILHGYSQKVGDANASVKGAKAKFDASRGEYDRMIRENSWYKIPSDTKTPKVNLSIAIQALMAAGKTETEAKTLLGVV